ncbi:MAG: alpha/beta hydrolase [Gammaproteobacteria bacterium]
MIIRRMLSLLLTYLLFLVIIFLFQRKLIYFPETHSVTRLQELAASKNLWLWPSEDDYRGLIARPAGASPKGTVIVFHGNAGSAVNRGYYAHALGHLGYRVILAEYPGYGARKGTPSEQAFIKDGMATADLALAEFGEPILLWGESLGAGVVSGIVNSRQIPVPAIVLVSPFDSLPRIAGHHYWYFLGHWLTRDRFDNVKNLRGYSGRTAMILAGQDMIIPNRYSLTLFKSLEGPKRLWEFKDAGHNSLPLSPGLTWWREVIQFVDGKNGESR